MIHRVNYTKSQYLFANYFQLLLGWTEFFTIINQNYWSACFHFQSFVDADLLVEAFSSLFHHVFQLLLGANNHIILQSCSRTNELSKEELGIPFDLEIAHLQDVDKTTGDYEEIPSDFFIPVTEYDYLHFYSNLLLSQLLEVQTVYQAVIPSFYSYCCERLQAGVELINQPNWSVELEDLCTIVKSMKNFNFGEQNLQILMLLSTLIK